ncbi:DNA-binding transcriptional regulator, LysR family [Hydrocarboniphaga daqingensis]|uniref:DNA-binding transcriptional regulator, LysR family n=1 Tax=Hydrocarboniphaga daqingensis TaxID=490188 RepID=A0A1M5ML71_9GAMM|nr:LysR family transcriptional regulator [Hydrocarboniphaga daqingensis]SHG77996.1 DNA-binding transcriptional regulator, LysR family [Hydrocarboniphaga daqingensis]
MELRHLRYFVAVAEELHFTRAAQRLGIGQPPLSQQIQQLETELGAPLFKRLPRGVALTEAGMAFFFDAKAVLAQVERATRNVQRIARGDQGAITIGMINSAPFHPRVQLILREFREQYRSVQLSLTEASTPELAKAVLAGTIDAAFVRPLISDDPGLIVETLFDEDLLIALPANHPLGQQKTLSVESLAREPFVMFSREVGSGLYDEIIAACRRGGFSPRIEQQASQVTSIVNLVAAGLGVSMVPASMRQINSDGVIYRRIDDPAPKARMSLVYRENYQSASLSHLLALARQRSQAP